MANESSMRVGYNEMAEVTGRALGHGYNSSKWGDIVSTNTITGDARAQMDYVDSTKLTTITTAGALLNTATDTGKRFVFRNGGSYVIDSVTSTSILVVRGDATVETIGNTASLTADVIDPTKKRHEIDETVQQAYRQVLLEHEWFFMKPTATLVAWSTYAVTANVTADLIELGQGSPPGANDDISLLTASGTSAPTFYESLEGKTITINSLTFTITRYVSSTKIQVLDTADTADFSDKTFVITATGDYLLPRDFGHMIGELTFASDEAYYTVPIVPETYIRDMRMRITGTGTPRWAAIRPVKTPPLGYVEPQRYELMLCPIPSSNHNLTYQYSLIPERLDRYHNPYPVGGQVLGELYLQACRMVAEQIRDKEVGVQSGRYDRLLVNAKLRDSRSEPDLLGYNLDPDVVSLGGDGHLHYHRRNVTTTYVP